MQTSETLALFANKILDFAKGCNLFRKRYNLWYFN